MQYWLSNAKKRKIHERERNEIDRSKYVAEKKRSREESASEIIPESSITQHSSESSASAYICSKYTHLIYSLEKTPD